MSSEKQQEEIKEIEKKVSEVCDTTPAEQDNNEINISLIYDLHHPSLKEQVQEQGFVIDSVFMDNADEIKRDLHSLKRVGILSEKQLYKCFKKMHKAICGKILKSVLKEGERAIEVKDKKSK
jgi:hypothetical protein